MKSFFWTKCTVTDENKTKPNKNSTNTNKRNKMLRPLNLKCPVLYLNKENNPAKAGTEMKTVQQRKCLQVYSLLGSSSAQSEQESPLQVWVSGTGEPEAPGAEARGVPPFAHLYLLHKASEKLVFCWRILTSSPWAGSAVTLADGFRATHLPGSIKCLSDTALRPVLWKDNAV